MTTVACPLRSVFASPSLAAGQEACILSVLAKLLRTRTGEDLLGYTWDHPGYVLVHLLQHSGTQHH